jgi:hypothetical protein
MSENFGVVFLLVVLKKKIKYGELFNSLIRYILLIQNLFVEMIFLL